jgi:DNA-binding CsgD family transcriptional regulator
MAQSSTKTASGYAGARIHRQVGIVFRTALDALFVLDDERRHLLANAAAARLLGCTVAEILERRMDDFSPPAHLGGLRRRWEEFESTGSLEGLGELQRLDGCRVPIEFRASRDFRPGQHLMAARRCLTPAADTVDVNGDPLKCPLTPRELEVLQLGSEGHSTREIAEALFVSPGTVKTHFQHVYEKLGSHDRAAAVAEALRRGLIA